jgi:hypothetical protein
VSLTLIAFLLGMVAGVCLGVLAAIRTMTRLQRDLDRLIATWHPAAPCEEYRHSLNKELHLSRWMTRALQQRVIELMQELR